MRFSIRQLLALTFVIALCLLAWRISEDVKRDKARLVVIQNEIESLRATVRLDNPALHQALLRMSEETQSLTTVRQTVTEQFSTLRDKYGSIEPRGPGILSLRGVPELKTGLGPAPVTMRLIVPAERPVWLKYGVHHVKRGTNSSRNSEREDDLLHDSPFTMTGPYEVQLAPGEQLITIAIEMAHDGSLPIRIETNGHVLRTTYVDPDVSGSSLGHVSGATQIDYRQQRELPWLLTANINCNRGTGVTRSDYAYGFSVWLSEQSSDFEAFPEAADE